MSRLRSALAGLTAASALALSAAPATADPPSDPDCWGRLVQHNNQFFNFGSPSGNEQAAAGPGLFFGPHTGETLQEEFRAVLCG